MIKKIFTLTFLIVAAFSSFASAQKQKLNTLYAAPTELILKNNDEQVDETSGRFGLIAELFYPIGWSKNGVFAYYTEPADEACGCYFADLIIQDMRTDKILWQKKYNRENGGEDTLKKYWAKNRNEFSRKLAQYGIVPHKNFTPLDSPLKTAADTVNVDLFSDVKLTEDAYNSEGNVVIKLISNQKGAKTVYQKTYDGKGYDGIMNAALGGMLSSPFEPRIAVILIETYRGYECPPNITNIKIIGAALTGGFR